MELLWVENHPQFTRFARPFLAEYSVTIVPSLAAARAALGQTRFDMVLVDFDLDDGKGTELVRELVAGTGRPLIVATASHADGNTALLQAGADAAHARKIGAHFGRSWGTISGNRACPDLW
jgi:DNA-binding response OmpR family regulator